MSLPYARPLFADGPIGIARPCSLPVFSSPIPGVKDELLITQKWYQSRNNFAAADLGSPTTAGLAHPDYPSFFLVEEGQRDEIGCGVVEWQRMYAAVPATHSEPEMFTYTFPGITGTTFVYAGTIYMQAYRAPFTIKTLSMVKHEYFFCASGQTYTAPSSIPKLWAMQYCAQLNWDSGSNTITSGGNPDNTTKKISAGSGTVKGGVDFAMNSLSSQFGPYYSLPNVEQYQWMVADASANGWGASITNQVISVPGGGTIRTIDLANSVWGGQIAAEDSVLSRWRGNIFLRRTRYVLAQ